MSTTTKKQSKTKTGKKNIFFLILKFGVVYFWKVKTFSSLQNQGLVVADNQTIFLPYMCLWQVNCMVSINSTLFLRNFWILANFNINLSPALYSIHALITVQFMAEFSVFPYIDTGAFLWLTSQYPGKGASFTYNLVVGLRGRDTFILSPWHYRGRGYFLDLETFNTCFVML